jgi:L-threonylcarbamoyladenylate synthase
MNLEVARAAELLRAGQLVAFPTETVYGLGANALDERAVAEIFRVKGRPATSPLIVHAASTDEARDFVASWPEAAERLARRHWPGPLTLVLPKRPDIPAIVTAGLDTVGIRVPAHPVAIDFIRAAEVPVAAPSANRFTELSPTCAEHVRRSLPGVFVLDGGPTPIGIESTVLSLAGSRPVLLRPGMVSRREIEDLIGPVELSGGVSGAHPSPGMHERHYSPRTPLYLGTPPAAGRGVVVALPAEPFACAAALYATLHRYDLEGWDWLAIEIPPETPEWDGIRDRLQRAARS